MFASQTIILLLLAATTSSFVVPMGGTKRSAFVVQKPAPLFLSDVSTSVSIVAVQYGTILQYSLLVAIASLIGSIAERIMPLTRTVPFIFVTLIDFTGTFC